MTSRYFIEFQTFTSRRQFGARNAIRTGLLSIAIELFAALSWVPKADAYQFYSQGINDVGNCAACHGAFAGGNYTSIKDGSAWGTNLHNGHRSSFPTGMLDGDCNTCHGGPLTSGRQVDIDSSSGGSGLDPLACIGCHGRAEDASPGNPNTSGSGIGAGLRRQHWTGGVTLCAGCHEDANPANGYTPVAENVQPPYYFEPDPDHTGKPSDACNNPIDPNRVDSKYGATGLDNDGNGQIDGADSACAANTPPVADANGPYSGTVGVPVSFDGSASNDPDGTIVSYDWDFGDGTIALDAGPNPTHTYATDGNFNVILTVTDDAGDTGLDTTTATIGIGDLPPVADANGPYSGTVGIPVQFDGSGSNDPDGTIVAYDWDFGDGISGAGVAPTHTYGAAGIYNVTLTVTDDSGLTDSAGTTADIAEPGVLDLDIAQFSVTKRVSASRPKLIGIKLVVKNNGTVEGSAMATITGVQNGSIVYSEMLQVTDPIGNGRTRYGDGSIPPVPPYLPVAEGDILWTATIADDDPDIDEATAVTRVVP